MNIQKQMVIICTLLNTLGKIDGRTKLQKLFFLLDNKINLDLEYEKSFYGPFSNKLSNIVELMIRDGTIKEDIGSSPYGRKYLYEITPKGKNFLADSKSVIAEEEEAIKKEIEALSDFNKMNLDDLILYIYKTYPKFARNTN